jgi:hypothetical protein
MPKINETVTRVDFRCPIDIFEAIESIATANGHRINHKSGKVEISSTLIDLLRIGLAHYSPDELSDITPDKRSGFSFPDNLVTIDHLETAIESLRSEFAPALELAGK